MSGKLFRGDISNSVVELNLLDGDAGTLSYGLGGTNNGEIRVVHKGDITQSSGFYDAGSDFGSGDMKGLVIGTSCTSIGSSAFYYCTNLTGDLVIPDSVTTIEGGYYAGAFLGTSGVTSLTIGNSVTSIGDYAFYLCVAYGAVGDLVIPDSVLSIGYYAFGNCGLYGTLTIGNSVTSIGSRAFYYCNNTRVEIHATTAPTIGAIAFAGMNSVSPAEIHVPVGATGYAASYDGLTVVADL